MSKTKTLPYDSAEYLKTDEDIQQYLEACFEEGGDDAAFILHALGVVARAKGMMQISRETGLAREALYRSLSAEGNPSFATVLKVLNSLGVHLSARPIAI